MYIEKISIENFRIFEKKITLDLKPNMNGIKKDLEMDYFIEKENGYMSTVNAIGGTNSFGKTTFIDSMKFVKKYFDNHYIKKAFNRSVLNEWFKNHKKNKKTLLNDILKKLNQINNEIYFANINDKSIIEYKNEEIKIAYNKNKTKKNLKKTKKNKQIKISIKFIDKEIFTFVYEMNNKEEKHHFFDKNNKKIIKIEKIEKLDKKVKKIFNENIKFLEFNLLKISEKFRESDFENIIDNLFLNFKEEGLISFLNIADRNIKSLDLLKNTVKGFILENDGIIKHEDLSYGTKKIIYFTYEIIKTIKNSKNEAFFFIDEIENGLHYSLVEFLKKLIRKFAKEKDVQLFFTSHNIYALSNNLSNKQILFLENDLETGYKIFKKVSNRIKPKNSAMKKYFEEKIGSHPFETDIDNFIDNILEDF